MIDCDVLRDAMPDVAHGRAAWSDWETAHLASCAECALEWRIVQAGVALGAGPALAPDRIAASVSDRLLEAGVSRRVIGRVRWRAAAVGLTALAASAMLYIGLAGHRRSPDTAIGDTMVALGVLPELQALDATQLQTVLRSLGPTAADATPGVLPHLEDLTDSELEELLRSEGGQ